MEMMRHHCQLQAFNFCRHLIGETSKADIADTAGKLAGIRDLDRISRAGAAVHADKYRFDGNHTNERRTVTHLFRYALQIRYQVRLHDRPSWTGVSPRPVRALRQDNNGFMTQPTEIAPSDLIMRIKTTMQARETPDWLRPHARPLSPWPEAVR